MFSLHLTIDLPTPPPIDPVGGVLGVDLGIVELATDSEGNQYSGDAVKACRRRVREHRRRLQKKNSRSAYKRLQKIRRRQSRFTRQVNHLISKALVGRALSQTKALAIEDLKGIKERASVLSREVRWLMGNWAFDQLRQFLGYKCEAAGVPLICVDPRNTSRTCSKCGHCEKANRKSQSRFECIQCGFCANADMNASVNISRKGAEARAELSNSLMFRTTANACV